MIPRWSEAEARAYAREQAAIDEIVARAEVESSPVIVRQMTEEEMAAANVVRQIVPDIRAGLAEGLSLRQIAERWGSADLPRICGIVSRYRLAEGDERVREEMREIMQAHRAAEGCSIPKEESEVAKGWRPDEDAIIKQFYPSEGYRVMDRLPGRTMDAVGRRARDLGVKRLRGLNQQAAPGQLEAAATMADVAVDADEEPREVRVAVAIEGRFSALEARLLETATAAWVRDMMTAGLTQYGLRVAGIAATVERA